MSFRVRRQGAVEISPLFPRAPFSPGRRSDGVWKAAAPRPPPGTLPHPLENASRFPQPAGHDGELAALVLQQQEELHSRH